MYCASVAICSHVTKSLAPVTALNAVIRKLPQLDTMSNPIEQAVQELVTAAAVEASLNVTAGKAAGAAGVPPKPPPAALPKVPNAPPNVQPPSKAESWASAEDQWMGWSAEYGNMTWDQAVPKIPQCQSRGQTQRA